MKRLLTALICTAAITAHAGLITVDKAGSGDYTTIAAGIRATVPGDTVVVEDGLYDEHVAVGSAYSGTAANPVIIRARNRHQARVIRFLVSAKYVTIDGFEVANSTLHGIGNSSQYVTITNNHVHDCADYGIQSGKYGYVAGNLIERVQRGIWAEDHSLVEYNRIIDLNETADARYSQFAGDSIVIRNNFMWNDTTTGDFTRTHAAAKDFLFENNYCFNTKHGSESEPTGNNDQLRFTYRNNVFVNCFMVGIWVKAGIEQVSSINNTFVNCGTYSFKLLNEYDAGNVAKNNIIYYYGSRRYGLNQYVPNLGISGPGVYPPETDYNLYYGTPGDKMSYNTDYPGDLPSANEFTADPLFVKLPPDGSDAYFMKSLADTAEWDLHLQAGSPAIDAGVDVGLAYDRDWNVRPDSGNAPDLGAYEHNSVPGDPVSSVDELRAAQGVPQVRLYPLPVRDQLTVTGVGMVGTLRILDGAGIVVWKGTGDAGYRSIDIPAGLGSGRYYLSVSDGAVIVPFCIIR